MENSTLKDIAIIVPAEFIDDFYKVIESGLERAKLTGDVRKSLKEWWEVERCFIK